jgi:peptidyl-tRNA hydrolase, PTH1 family
VNQVRLIVGLGNPGALHVRNRHNIGFVLVDEIARRLGATWLKRGNHEIAEARVGAGKLFLMKPQTYMNLSGDAVVPFARFHKLEPTQILVAHDDLDLPFGRIRIRTGGSSGGQNGLKDISAKLATEQYPRLKLGISRPPAHWTVVNWVLSNFQPNELSMLEDVIRVGADAAAVIVKDGVIEAQNQFNSTDLRPKPEKPEPETREEASNIKEVSS